MGEMIAFGMLLLSNLLLFGICFFQRGELRKLEKEIIGLEAALRSSREEVHNLLYGTPQNPKNYQVDKENPVLRPIANSAQARKMVDRANAGFFSAEKHIPNSEIAKENANG